MPDAWHTVRAQEMSVPFSLFDAHVFAALEESGVKVYKEGLIFHLLSIFCFLFSER